MCFTILICIPIFYESLGVIQNKLYTGCPKKMQHSAFPLRSDPKVQSNISACVSESEF